MISRRCAWSASCPRSWPGEPATSVRRCPALRCSAWHPGAPLGALEPSSTARAIRYCGRLGQQSRRAAKGLPSFLRLRRGPAHGPASRTSRSLPRPAVGPPALQKPQISTRHERPLSSGCVRSSACRSRLPPSPGRDHGRSSVNLPCASSHASSPPAPRGALTTPSGSGPSPATSMLPWQACQRRDRVIVVTRGRADRARERDEDRVEQRPGILRDFDRVIKQLPADAGLIQPLAGWAGLSVPHRLQVRGSFLLAPGGQAGLVLAIIERGLRAGSTRLPRWLAAGQTRWPRPP